jgi:hypothetical protein
MTSRHRPDLHNPVSGQAQDSAGFVIGEAQARAMFRFRLHEMQAELMPVVRQACKLPESQLDDAACAAWMQAGIDLAVANGMACMEDVVGFMAMLRSVGPRFHEFPAVRKYLARPDLPATGRILGLFEALPLALWAVVQRRSSGGAAR